MQSVKGSNTQECAGWKLEKQNYINAAENPVSESSNKGAALVRDSAEPELSMPQFVAHGNKVGVHSPFLLADHPSKDIT